MYQRPTSRMSCAHGNRNQQNSRYPTIQDCRHTGMMSDYMYHASHTMANTYKEKSKNNRIDIV